MSEIFGFGPFFITVPHRIRQRAHATPGVREPGQPQQATPGARASSLDVATEAGAGLGGLPDFSRPVTRTRAS